MRDEEPVFCGKCGTPNPADNSFCRRCGHQLSEDIVEVGGGGGAGRWQPPVSPVPGVELVRYPLVDPETGEELVPAEPPLLAEVPAEAGRGSAPPPRRGSVILWSLALHAALVSVLGLITLVVMSQVGVMPSPATIQTFQTEAEELRQRFEASQIDSEEAEREGRQLLQTHGLSRLLMIIAGPVLLAFFLGGLLAGRLWRPRRLLDVGLSGLVIGGLCSLCLISPLIWPLAIGLSMVGALVGRRWR